MLFSLVTGNACSVWYMSILTHYMSQFSYCHVSLMSNLRRLSSDMCQYLMSEQCRDILQYVISMSLLCHNLSDMLNIIAIRLVLSRFLYGRRHKKVLETFFNSLVSKLCKGWEKWRLIFKIFIFEKFFITT